MCLRCNCFFFSQMGKSDFCCTPNCSNRRNRQRNIQFYRIPKDKAVKQKWLQRIRRKGFQPTESTRLCSQHFLGGKRSMDPASASYLPSVFDHSHNKSVKTIITRTSRNAGSQVDHVPKVKRKSSRVSPLNALYRLDSFKLIHYFCSSKSIIISVFYNKLEIKCFLAAVHSFTRNIKIILIN